jgi:hypothetical protein
LKLSKESELFLIFLVGLRGPLVRNINNSHPFQNQKGKILTAMDLAVKDCTDGAALTDEVRPFFDDWET